MVNAYTGYTGGLNINASTNGMFTYNGSALGYACGNNLTAMCHKGNAICVANGSIANHLSKGDFLGTCLSNRTINNKPEFEDLITGKQLNIYPNPISNSTTISFSLAYSGKVSLKIFDVTGQLIKMLVNGELTACTHQLNWNARDEKRNTVPAAVYLLRLDLANYSETKKLLVK